MTAPYHRHQSILYHRSEHRQVVRAQIILLAAEGKQNVKIAADLGIFRQNVARWRNRYIQNGLSGIMKDAPRGGRPVALTPKERDEIINIVLHDKNKTQWSVRSLAKRTGASQYAVYKISAVVISSRTNAASFKSQPIRTLRIK